MNISRVLSPFHSSIQAKKRLKRTKSGREWLEKQVNSQRAWTLFSYPLDRLKFCYNLSDSMFETVCTEYQAGRTATDVGSAMTPRNPCRIRQDILAAILILKEDLCHRDFIVAKRLATLRNTGRANSTSSTENTKWPARPDIFLHCPTPEDSAVSDDELSEYFMNEKYRERESFDEEHDESTEGVNGKPNMDFELYFSSSSEENVTSPHVNDTLQMYRGRCDTVRVLKDISIHSSSIKSIDGIRTRYGVSRTKAYEIRAAVKDLRNGEIEGVTFEAFEKTFDNESIMNMTLQRDKRRSIQLAIWQHRNCSSSLTPCLSTK